MAKVLLPLAEGFEEIEAVTIIDVLRRAEIEVVLASLEKKQVVGAHAIRIQAEIHIEDIKNISDFDMIVLPGGLPGAYNLQKNENVQKLIKEFNEAKKYVGAICAAPIALREAGVLEKYTCYPSFEEQIGKDGYTNSNNVISDKNIITSKGPATAMEFALEIVSQLISGDKSKQIRGELLL